MTVDESSEGESSEGEQEIPKNCQKHPKIKNIPKSIQDISAFCELLQANKVKDSKEAFLKLPFMVQCMFLEYAWDILSNKSKHSPESYMSSFLLFKLFRGKDMKGEKIYSRYTNLKSLEAYYKKAKESKKKSPSTTTKKTSPRVNKKYDKDFQKYEAPKSELDPLYIFYTSLYSQQPDSALAATWLTEHGVFDGSERKKLTKRYEKLKADGKLIK